MPVVEYYHPLGKRARKRHYHETKHGKVIDFMVQLEVKAKGEWREVIRYDCAHGYAHMDRYNLEGKREKEDLELSYEDALTFADTDINDNWEMYRQKFLEGGYP